MLEDRALAHRVESWQNDGPQDVASVADAVKVAQHVMKRSACVEADASLHHDGAAAIAVVLLDGGVLVLLSSAPPDPVPPVVEGKREPGLV